jgi:hypothetical protein
VPVAIGDHGQPTAHRNDDRVRKQDVCEYRERMPHRARVDADMRAVNDNDKRSAPTTMRSAPKVSATSPRKDNQLTGTPMRSQPHQVCRSEPTLLAASTTPPASSPPAT